MARSALAAAAFLTLLVPGASVLFAQDIDLSFSYQSDFLWRFARDACYGDGTVYILMPNGIALYSGGVDFVAPTLISKLPMGVDCDNIELYGDTAVCMSRRGSVRLVDVSDRYRPRECGEIELGDTLFDFAVIDSVGYAACGFRGLLTLAQSGSHDMRVTSHHDEAVHVVAVESRQGRLYVADDFNGLFTYDLANPFDPALIDVRFFSRPVNDISFNGDTLYVAYGDSGVVSFTLQPDGGLERLTAYPTPVSALKVDAFGSVIATVDLLGTIYLFDADSTAPRYVAEKRRVSDRVQFVRKNDRDYVILPDRFGNVDIVSVDRGIQPDLVWRYPGSKIVKDVAVLDGTVFVSGAEDDITIWRSEEVGAADLIGSIATTTAFTAVESLDSLVIVAETGSDESSLIQVFQALAPCCIAEDKMSFLAYPDLVDLKASKSDSDQVDVVVYGNDGSTLVRLRRIDDEGDIFYPVVANADVPSRGNLTAAEWANGYLYTASTKGAEGLIYDAREIGRGTALSAAGEFGIPGKVNVLEVFDDVCYMGGSFGLSVRRMNGFEVGEELVRVLPGMSFMNVAFDWKDSLMFAALGGHGVAVLDVADLAEPVLLDQRQTLGVAERLDAQGGTLAVADHYSVMLFSYHLSGRNGPILPRVFTLEQNYPNPFNRETTIEFSVPEASNGGHVSLDIFNVLGETTATLISQPLSAGRYTYRWDGTDRRGEYAASGIYFYRLSIGSASQTKKLVLLK